MIRRAKGFELMIFKKNWFEYIWFKSVFDLGNYGVKVIELATIECSPSEQEKPIKNLRFHMHGFIKCALTKVVHIYVIKGMNA